jgi:DNA-binding MarR family transcriptional regulator
VIDTSMLRWWTMDRLPDAIDYPPTAVLLAITEGARSFDDIMDATGISRSEVHRHLHALIDEGLVAMERGKQGTIRPLCRQIPLPA